MGAKLPLGPAVDLAHLLHTHPEEWPPLPDGACYVGHRTELGVWVIVYGLPDGSFLERSVPRWQSEQNKIAERRASFRVVR